MVDVLVEMVLVVQPMVVFPALIEVLMFSCYDYHQLTFQLALLLHLFRQIQLR